MDIARLHVFPIKNYHPTPHALLGPGAHEMIGVSAAQLGFKRTLLMTTGLRGTGTVDEVKTIVENAGVEVVVFDERSLRDVDRPEDLRDRKTTDHGPAGCPD